MKVLELFSGTGSIGKHCDQLGYEVVSLDSDPEARATINIDIMNWDYTTFPKSYFDVIWASPPCTEYSTILVRRERRMDEADILVKRVLEIIDYYQPMHWFIENPMSGFLKSRDFMAEIPYFDVSYCKYGFPYQKHTRIWSNVTPENPLYCRKDCDRMRDGKHIGLVAKTTSLAMKHSIPPQLVAWIFNQIV